MSSDEGNTLEQLIAMDMDVTAVCHACNRYRLLDLESIRTAFGPGMSIRRVALRLRCESCGERDSGVLLARRGRYGN